MKLRNKKTGEIGELQITEKHCAVSVGNGTASCGIVIYSSLAELNEEWEDYEEPVKPYWFVNDLDGEPMECDLKNCGKSNFIEWGKHRKQIGNYFETREEAEKAVRKLEAWKRLKDKGFKVDLWDYDGGNYQERIRTGRILFRVKDYEENDKDLDLLFGGEE